MNTGKTDVPRLATVLIVLVVVIFGGIGLLLDKVSWSDYLGVVAIGGGLLGVGYGLDAHSKP